MQTLDIASFVAVDAAPALAPGAIHVWSLTLPDRLAAREVGATARGVLATLLQDYAGTRAPPPLLRGVHGKPYAPDLPDLDFNVSHSRHQVVLAFARGQAVGVDVEHLDRRVSPDDVAPRFFAADEAEALARVRAPVRSAAFLKLWTRKEAVLKALGHGLGFGLDRLCFAIGDDGHVGDLVRIAAEGGARADWRLLDLALGPGMVGALAWRGAPRVVLGFVPAAGGGSVSSAFATLRGAGAS